jgi:hypothetical protein
MAIILSIGYMPSLMNGNNTVIGDHDKIASSPYFM